MATIERRREKKREQVQAELNAYTLSILMRCLFMCCFMCLLVTASSAAGALSLGEPKAGYRDLPGVKNLDSWVHCLDEPRKVSIFEEI